MGKFLRVFSLVFYTLFLLMFLSLRLAAQNAAPTPTPTPKQDDVVKISTNLIQVDISVVDKKGKPVSDLRPDELEVYQNGKKQTLTNFSFISAGRASAKSVSTGNQGVSTGKDSLILPPVALPPSSVHRTIAIVVDAINLSFESVHFTQKALRTFVDEQMQEGDLVAILRTGGGVGALQAFTVDKRLLYAAIDRIRYSAMGTGGITAMAPIEASSKEIIDTGMGTMFSAEEEARIAAFLETARDARASDISSGTLGSLHYVIDGMKGLPGKRSVILFSDGFRLLERDQRGMLPTAAGANRNAPPAPAKPSAWQSGTTLIIARQVIDEANRSGVVFYAIDPRGMQPGTLTPSDIAAARGKSVKDLRTAVDERRDEMWESQNGLNFLSRETGGFLVTNSNDPSLAVSKVLEDQSYYLVAYVPDVDTFEAADKYDKLEIKTSRKDATARHRSGFFAEPAAKSKPISTTDKEPSPVEEMKEALFSPFPVSGIKLRLNTLWGRDTGNSSYVNTLIHVDARDLKFMEETDGSRSAAFDVLAASFGINGLVVDQIAKRYTITIPPEQLQKTLADGFVYHFKFPVTKPGGYQYRVAIRDAANGHIGAGGQFVLVPDLRKREVVLSTIALEDMSLEDFQRSSITTDPTTDTAIRRIKLGRVYRYSVEIYNAALDAAMQPNVETKVRVFREGKLIMDGPPKRFDPAGQADMGSLRFFGALAIGAQMEPGEYILQIVVIDHVSKEKRLIASQFVQFEVIK